LTLPSPLPSRTTSPRFVELAPAASRRGGRASLERGHVPRGVVSTPRFPTSAELSVAVRRRRRATTRGEVQMAGLRKPQRSPPSGARSAVAARSTTHLAFRTSHPASRAFATRRLPANVRVGQGDLADPASRRDVADAPCVLFNITSRDLCVPCGGGCIHMDPHAASVSYRQ
ncbi:hypothetical protein BD626DRAFT_492822, partial [Schizophyllum amplum]